MKHTITMFLSSLLLFLCLFYYWQKKIEFQKQLDGVEMRVFIERKQDKNETVRTITNMEGVAKVTEIATAEIIKMLKDNIDEKITLEEIALPYVLSIYPSDKSEEDLKKLALNLTKINGVIDVVYGQEAIAGLWREIRGVGVVVATTSIFLLFIFILSLSFYINSLPEMRHSRIFLLHGRNLTSLRIKVVFRAILLSMLVSSLSVGITYFAYLYISKLPNSVFLPKHWVYSFILAMMFIGLLTGSSKRFPISR